MHPTLYAFLSQTAQNGQPAQKSGGIAGLLSNPMMTVPVVLLIFYFLLIRPQGRQQKQHKLFLQNLKKGDEVVTNGGVIGRIVLVEDRSVTLDVGAGNKMRILKGQIAGAWVEKPAQGEATKSEAEKK